MPKKQKTRKQKILSDKRIKALPQTSDSTFSLKELPTSSEQKAEKHPVRKPTSPHLIITSDYQYISRDLAKIAILTAVIVVMEILLRAFIQ